MSVCPAAQAARARAYVPARASSRPDYAAFCEVAEAVADHWPEVRYLDAALPFVAADRPAGVCVASDDLGAFAAALSAYPGRRRTPAVRPYILAHLQAQAQAEWAAREERAALIDAMEEVR